MSRIKKGILGLTCLSIIILSQIPTAFGGPSTNNRIIYSGNSENGDHLTYVPATPKPYKIRVWYVITGDSTGSYLGKHSPACQIINNGQLIVDDHDVYGRTLSGYFDVLPDQQASVKITAGSAWGIGTVWSIPIWDTLTYYYDNDPPPAPILTTNAIFINNSWYSNGQLNLTWSAVSDNPLSFEASGYYGPSGIRGYKIFDSNSEISGGYITGTSKQLTLNEGIYQLTVKAYDNETYCNPNGNESSASNLVKVLVDKTSPVATISINNNSPYTNVQDVVLSLSNLSDGINGSGVSEVCFSNDNVTYSGWEPCTGTTMTKDWALTSGDGAKTVYMKLKDILGNETPNENPIQATITLDTTPPTGSFTINNGSSLTTSQLVTLTLTAEDALSGVAWMQFSNDGIHFSIAEEFNTTKHWTLSDGEGTKTVYVKLTDALGNISAQPLTQTIYYDQNPVFSGFTPVTTLQADTTWGQDHVIFGQVIVPAGINLTISPGVKVTIDGPTDCDPNQNGLIVEGSLNIESGATFTTLQSGWMGIIVSGSAGVTGANISLAERGMAILANATATINGCTFSRNFIGIHAYASQPVIANCTFWDNVYGIKEDESGRPAVTGCGFITNEVPYYHETLTRITGEQLNQIPGNSGNTDQD